MAGVARHVLLAVAEALVDVHHHLDHHASLHLLGVGVAILTGRRIMAEVAIHGTQGNLKDWHLGAVVFRRQDLQILRWATFAAAFAATGGLGKERKASQRDRRSNKQGDECTHGLYSITASAQLEAQNFGIREKTGDLPEPLADSAAELSQEHSARSNLRLAGSYTPAPHLPQPMDRWRPFRLSAARQRPPSVRSPQ